MNKLENLGRDMKKLKENVYAIQVRCQNCGGVHLDKDCPLKEVVKSVEEAKYGEFGRSSPFSNGAKYRGGPPGYYTRIDNRPLFGEKRPSLEELMNKHLEESTRRRTKMEEWVKKLQENAKINTRNQSASLKNLETQIEQLTKEFHTKAANDISSSSVDQCKAMYAEEKTPINDKQHEISILNPGNFTLPCTIGSLNFYAMADLGANVNVIPKSIFEHLKLARLKKTDMLVEMADMTKRSPLGIVENVLVKIKKFLFLLDFVVMDMLNTRNETMIIRRPFLATIHVKIDVFNREISLGIRGDKVTFDMDKKIHNFTTPIGEIYMINATSNTPSDASSRVEETNDVHNKTIIVIKSMDEVCNGGHEVYEMNKEGDLKKWYCYYDDDDRKRINGAGLSFPEFLLVKYGENQEKGLIWDERKVQGDNTYWWHDQKSKEEERRKLRINIEEYEPPMVHIETFEVKRYSFDTGQSFIYVTKELMDALLMGRENRSRFRDMIRKEVESGRRIHR
ncbi:reverse transcriptase domain-containing protein [Tanacetum coccineum]|uniref:Reverse transcriptase domain-containing protein n=1 Tax=Tanacetum coccineum TaxID=301880 RepID=A0ABQ5AP71_9ASTR